MHKLIDRSGIIQRTGQSQEILPSNKSRTGWLIQNRSLSPMFVNDTEAATSDYGSYEISPGSFFPPAGYPTMHGPVYLCGTVGSGFTLREW